MPCPFMLPNRLGAVNLIKNDRRTSLRIRHAMFSRCLPLSRTKKSHHKSPSNVVVQIISPTESGDFKRIDGHVREIRLTGLRKPENIQSSADQGVFGSKF